MQDENRTLLAKVVATNNVKPFFLMNYKLLVVNLGTKITIIFYPNLLFLYYFEFA